MSNVVFMGMGEPLDNVEAVIKAARILKDPWGLAIAPRKLTISTAGHLDGLKALVASGEQVALAHTDENVRIPQHFGKRPRLGEGLSCSPGRRG